MTDLYTLNTISKQAHAQALAYERRQAGKVPYYLGLIEELRELHPSIGLRNIYETYQPDGIGRDAFIELGKQHGYMLEERSNPVRTTYSVKCHRYKNLLADKEFTDVNQIWSSDITYYPLSDQHFYIVFIMDVYSRKIIGYNVADNMRAENNILALRMALTHRGIDDYHNQLIHHSDKGSQYASDAYTELLSNHNISISMCVNVYENAHIERVNGTIKNDYLKSYNIKTFKELTEGVKKAINIYNDCRDHQCLPNRKTPNQFETFLATEPSSPRPSLSIYTAKKNEQMTNQLPLTFDS